MQQTNVKKDIAKLKHTTVYLFHVINGISILHFIRN